MKEYDESFWEMADNLVASKGVTIDRPKGSHHPRYPEYIYPLDYGYINDTHSQDGAGIDVWIGSKGGTRVTAMISSIDLCKGDSEIKLLVGCSPEEIETVYRQHNRSESMRGILTVR